MRATLPSGLFASKLIIMKVVRAIVALSFLCFHIALAQSADEQYVRIYQIVQEADRLNEAGQGRPAAAKYLEAQDALRRFQAVYPGWNERVINYRLNCVATKLAPLTTAFTAAGTTNVVPQTSAPPTVASAPVTTPPTSAPPATVTSPVPATPPPTTAPSPMLAELQQQVSALSGEVERLQAENKRLAAKLKEALSVQPAAMDPRAE